MHILKKYFAAIQIMSWANNVGGNVSVSNETDTKPFV